MSPSVSVRSLGAFFAAHSLLRSKARARFSLRCPNFVRSPARPSMAGRSPLSRSTLPRPLSGTNFCAPHPSFAQKSSQAIPGLALAAPRSAARPLDLCLFPLRPCVSPFEPRYAHPNLFPTDLSDPRYQSDQGATVMWPFFLFGPKNSLCQI